MQILPSIASADVLNIAGEMERLRGWPLIHFDIEDGHFTPNMTFGQKTLLAVSNKLGSASLDVHLMADDPLGWLPIVKEAGAASVSAHLEALRFPLLFLNRAKQLGMRAGLALNFATPLTALEPFLPDLNFVLIMTAEPDENGEKLNDLAFDKALKAAKELPVPVYADGGLCKEHVLALHRAGAAGCVLGRLVFGAPDPGMALQNLAHELENLPK